MDVTSHRAKQKVLQIITLLLFPGVFVYYEILFKLFGGLAAGALLPMLFYAIAFGCLTGFFCIFIRPRVWRYIYIEIIFVIFAVYFIAECFIGKAFQTFMTPQAMFTGAGNVAEDFGDVVIQTITSGWYVILIYLLPAILVMIFRKKLFFSRKKIVPAASTLIASVLLFILGHILALRAPVYTNEYQFDASMRNLGVIATLSAELQHAASGSDDSFVITDSDAIVNEEEPAAEEEAEIVYEPNTLDIDFAALAASAPNNATANLDNFIASQSGSLKNEYTGIFEGKNLILICAEAFSPYAVSEELTPTLYRMMHNGFYFSDYYQPAWGGSTSTGEYSVLTGLIPTNGVNSIRKTEGHNMYFTIANQLSRIGYYTAAFHNNSYTYYSRNLTHPNLGYSIYMGMGNGMEAGVTNCWPQSDLEMIDFTLPQYIDQQPFSVYYMTVSGHCAYSQGGNAMSKKNWEAVQNLEYSDTIKAYFASQLELEYAMASMITQLETAGILDDTVICLTSDHYPYGLEAGATWGNSQNYLPELYGCAESEINKFKQDKNGLIIWSGSLENELADYATEISEPTYSLDIVPTLSNLFGTEFDSRMLAGRDVFSDAEALVIWPDYSWKTSLATYQAGSGIVTPTTDEAVSEEYVNQIKTIVQNKFNLSQITLDYDYWQHVFQESAANGAEE